MKTSVFNALLTVIVCAGLLLPVPAWAAPAMPAERGSLPDPGRPALVTEEEIAREQEARRVHEVHTKGDFVETVEQFRSARTVRGLNHLLYSALAILMHHGDGEAEELVAHAHRAYNEAVRGLAPTVTPGYEGAGACDIDFDHAAILGSISNPDDPQALYTHPLWSQACGDGVVMVEPTVYDHTHLLFEDADIDCIDLNTGLYGRGEPGNCTPLVDAAQEPRAMGTHTGEEVIRIRLLVGGVAQPFSMHSFGNVGDVPVKFRFKGSNGAWYQWHSLGGNTIWDVSAHVVNVTEVLITNAGTSLSCGTDWITSDPAECPVGWTTFTLDDISISP